MMRRSLRLRLAVFSSLSIGVVFCLIGGFLYSQVRSAMLRDIRFMIESKTRVFALGALPLSVEWSVVERSLIESGGNMTLFVWQPESGSAFWTDSWPKRLDPREVVPGLVLPEDWRAKRSSDAAPAPLVDGAEVGEREVGRTNEARAGLRRLSAVERPAGDPARHYGAFEAAGLVIVMGADLALLNERLLAFRRLLLTALVPGMALSIALGLGIATRSLSSLKNLVGTIRKVTAHGLSERVSPEQSDREFAPLISVFNETLERLQRSFEDSRRFTDAAAHELRSPLTILQCKLDEAMRSEPPGSKVQQTLAELMEEVARLRGIVNQLLLLARTDAGRLDLYRESVDLGLIIEGMIEDARILTPHLRFEYEGKSHWINCDRGLILQVLHNLLSNAAKYNRAKDGFVKVEIHAQGEKLQIRVTNSGPPIPPEQAAHIFERFYRSGGPSALHVEGTGLGLSVAREIVGAHGGDLELERSDGCETVFRLTLPTDPSPSPPIAR
jgi:signal transduction histidine kinase